MSNVLDFFLSPAYAQATQNTGAEGSGFSLVIMSVGLLLFMYFAMWRPQSKRVREQQNLLDSLGKGDEVVSSGGLLGRIEKIEGQYITVSLAQNVTILMQKSAVVSVMPKGTIKSLDQDNRKT